MTRFHQQAVDAWGADLPAWVELLASECDRTSQSDVAKRIRYQGSVIGPVLRRKYGGSYDAIAQAVEGAFKSAKVACPVLGEMAQQDCLEHQRRPYAGTNNIRVRLYKACRAGCPHSRIPNRSSAKE